MKPSTQWLPSASKGHGNHGKLPAMLSVTWDILPEGTQQWLWSRLSRPEAKFRMWVSIKANGEGKGAQEFQEVALGMVGSQGPHFWLPEWLHGDTGEH